MTAQEEEDQRVTQFTLALLEGTGWYTPNYSMADPMFWGQGKGCGFHDTTCMIDATTPRFDEYCGNLDADGCSWNGKSRGYCGTVVNDTNTSIPASFNYFGNWEIVEDSYSDNCPYFMAYSSASCQDITGEGGRNIAEEIYSNNSMCFSGTIRKNKAASASQQYCFQQTVTTSSLFLANMSKCTQPSPNTYNILITVGNSTGTCTAAGPISVDGILYSRNLSNYYS